MSDTNQIRESLMKIRQSQNDLLRELKSEHDALQGYISSNENPYSLPEYRPYGLANQNLYQSFENSLQLSKSEGNMPGYKGLAHRSTTTGAEDILQNNYKKIEELLVKQRKIYQQNHALQDQNQSLVEDYRELKKLYYQLKESNKDNLIMVNFLLNQIVFSNFQDLLLETPNEQIASKTLKAWNRFKNDHPRLFNSNSSAQKFIQECQKYLEKMFSILDQDFKINSIKTKDEQIQQLKQRITKLMDSSGELNRNRMQLTQMENRRRVQVEFENEKLHENVKSLQRQLFQLQSEQLTKSKKFEIEIINNKKIIEEMNVALLEKESQIEQIKVKALKFKHAHKDIDQQSEELKKVINELKLKLKQKQGIYNQQFQINLKQNILIERMGRDIAELRNQLQYSGQRRTENHSKLFLQNQGLTRELNQLKSQFERYRQAAQRQINSLVIHSKEIKNQHAQLLKSQQNARINQMRYREMVASKNNQVKFNSTIEHLWSVKEIQYENIILALASTK